MRIQKIKSMQALRERERHNTRNKTVLNADNSKNIKIEGKVNLVPKVQALEKQLNKINKRKTRKDAIRVIEILFTSDKQFFNRVDGEQYFELCKDWLKETFGEFNILQSVIHLDEECEHMHCILTTVKDNKFNYSAYVGGRQDLRALQDSFHKKVECLGLQRGQKSEITQSKYTQTKEWHKKVQKAEEKVKALNPENRFNFAIKGVLAEEEQERLQSKINILTTDNTKLKTELKEVIEKERNTALDLQALKNYNRKFIEGNRVEKEKRIDDIVKSERIRLKEMIKEFEIPSIEELGF